MIMLLTCPLLSDDVLREEEMTSHDVREPCAPPAKIGVRVKIQWFTSTSRSGDGACSPGAFATVTGAVSSRWRID